MFKKLFLWLEILMERHRGADMIIVCRDGKFLLVPGTKKARNTIKKQFSDRFKKTMGGYILPKTSWKEEYDILHHGPCPIAVWI